jgi:hypothetical protein
MSQSNPNADTDTQATRQWSKKAAFLKVYQKELVPYLIALEAQRLDTVKQANVAWGILIGLGLLLAGLSLAMVGFRPQGWWLHAGVGVSAAGAGLEHWLSASFRLRFKQAILKPLMAFVDAELVYLPEGRMSSYVFDATGWFALNNLSHSGDDWVKGKLDGYPCQFSEFKARTTNQKNNTTVFHGLLLELTLPQPLKHKHVLRPGKHFSLPSWLTQALGETLQPVAMGDTEFEALFDVTSTDSIEAHKLFSPLMMQTLVALSKQMGAPLYMSAWGDKLTLGVNHGKVMFEPKLRETVLSATEVYSFVEELMTIRGLVEALKLQQKTWAQAKTALASPS